jgi:hypothetical protein
MRRLSTLVAIAAAALAVAGGAAADPSHNIQGFLTIHCDNGKSYVVNTGTLTNQSHQAFIANGTGIFKSTYLAFTDGTETVVLFETSPGLEAQGGLLTCTGDLAELDPSFEGLTLITRGFITPRQ